MAMIPLEPVVRWAILSTYFLTLLILSGYGAHRWYLLYLYRY